MTRWRPVGSPISYRPEELVRLEQALTVLRFMCEPTIRTGYNDSGRVTGTGSSSGPGVSLDPTTLRFRRQMKRTLRRIDQLVREIVAAATDATHDPPRWNCPKCNRFQRAEAVACDRCIPQQVRPDLVDSSREA